MLETPASSPSTCRRSGSLKSWLRVDPPEVPVVVGGDINGDLEEPRSEREAEIAADVRRLLARWGVMR
eukprot:11195425-Lingulodinium_polyedra.AAC.1